MVDLETAAVIQRIFEETAAGVKLLTIGRTLTNEGVPTPAQILIRRGFASPTRFRKMSGDWTRTMLRRILSNPAHIGQYIAYRTITFSDPERVRAVLETQRTHHSDEDDREKAHRKAVEGQLREMVLQLENATRSALLATNDAARAQRRSGQKLLKLRMRKSGTSCAG